MPIEPCGCTHGLPPGVIEVIRVGIDRLALDLVGPAAVVAKTAGSCVDIGLGHDDGLAVVERLDGGKLVYMAVEEVGELDEQLAAVLWRLPSPVALEGLACGGDGDVDILLGGLVDGANDVLSGGVDDLKGLAVDTGDKLVVDEAAGSVCWWRIIFR